ncbi:putative surface protein with fasciclin (FAS1) repeats [Mucilaginibacter yixingensis]|uniref:Putative surface protein with fasciclin (FAS1) repeats n=1 Tax=Mucilaginibacter yixingensis TaxID=1295612 RepID=A0A2T5J6M6_9SPHI|nr:fasciclin domain-containing protein [Mucilaginibacter yixingensis]PTQ94803.1 putative surface protein with fasciclin (FAS1) repeats [Mucilaginibacter yixingensis]
MKCTGLILILSLMTATCFAQRTDTTSKGVKTKVVDGVNMTTNQNIIQNFSKSTDYTTLVNAINKAGLVETFESKGPITLFAPTNAAFAKLPAGELDSLLKPAHKFELSNLLTYHAIPGRVTAKDIARNIKEHNGSAVYTTLSGSKLSATIDANRNIVLTDENGGQSIIKTFDIEQSNGMVHIVTAVVVPKKRMI